MLNIIADVGKIVSSKTSGNVLEFLIPESTSYKYIISINFRIDEKKVDFDLLIQGGEHGLSKQKLQEYLFVPAERGNRPQFSPTSDKLPYLISQTLPNLCDFLPENSQLKTKLQNVLDDFFDEIRERNGNKTSLVLNPLLIDKNEIISIDDAPNKTKEAIANYAKELADHIAEQTTAPAKESLYTLCLNGEPIAFHEDYRSFLVRKNLESAFEGGMESHCSICGTTGKVTQDTTRFMMKFYMTDKVNFASHFDTKNYFKAVTACQVCYQNIIVGEKWIDKHLRTRLGGLAVYILPQMVWPDVKAERAFRQLKEITNEFNEIKNIKAFREAEKKIADRAERDRVFENNGFIWNFLFFYSPKGSSMFKIRTLIKDVPPSRILKLRETTNYVDEVRKALSIPEHISFDLDHAYWLIPLRKIPEKGGRFKIEYNKMLQLYNCILNETPVARSQLYNFFVQLACMHHFENYGLYQIGKQNNPDYALMADTLKWNLFLLFMQKLNLIDGGSPMDTTELDAYYPDGVKQAVTEFGYSAAQRGLALLGYVIGVIAYAQSERENLKNKPVLEKINYQGMSEEKVMRLFNDAFEKIRQYRRHIGYAERWWALAKKLYETGSNEKLTSDERVFYLLSGYSMNLLRSKPETEKTNQPDESLALDGGQTDE